MMTDEMQKNLKILVISHEGCRNFIYKDIFGNESIGIGYNIQERGLSDAVINDQYNEDVNFYYNSLLRDYPWYSELNEARQISLIDMAFMGYKKLTEFTRMMAAFAEKDYDAASREILDSEWAKQVKGRAKEIATIVLTGVL